MNGTLQLQQRIGDDPLIEIHLAHWSGSEQPVRARRLKRRLADSQSFRERLSEASSRFAGVRGPGLLPHLAWLPDEQPPCWLEPAGPETALELVLKRLSSREVRLSPPAAVLLGERLAGACGRLHEQGLVLGLLAPADVLLDERGQPWLAGLGFGWALVSSKQARGLLDRARRQFLAPELTQGRSPEPSADVWALAALTYLLLTGQAPLEAGNGAVSTRTRQVTPPSRLNRSLPYGCDAVFLNALAPAPARRTADAAALAQALRRLRASLPGAGQEEAELEQFLANLLPNEVRAGTARQAASPSRPPPAPSPAAPRPGEEQEVTTQVTAVPQAPVAERAFPVARDTEPATAALPAPPPRRTAGATTERPAPPAAPVVPDGGWQPVGNEGEAEPGVVTRQMPAPSWSEPEEDTPGDIAPPAPEPAAGPAPAADTSEIPAAAGRRPLLDRQLLLPAGVVVAVLVLAATVWALWPSSDEPGPWTADAGLPRKATAIAFLSVEAEQPIEVTVDGEPLPAGRPVRRLLLTAGTHRVVVRDRRGRQLYDRQLELEPGQHQVLNLVITPAPAPARVAPAGTKKNKPRRKPTRRRRSRRRR